MNQLVDRFFEARKMMSRMAGQMGMPGAGRKNQRKGKKGKGKGRGPTQSKNRAMLPGGMPGMPPGMPDLSQMPPGLDRLPPGLEGIDLNDLKFPKR